MISENHRRGLLLFAVLASAGILCACGGGGDGPIPSPPPTPPPPPAQPTITTTTLPKGVEGSYQQTLQADGGTPPYTWALVSEPETLPPFLELSTSGLLSGNLLKPGEFSFIVRVTDSKSSTAEGTVSLTVLERLRITRESSPLPLATLNKPYSFTFQTTGGTGAGLTWKLGSGNLPDGIQLNEDTGEISGTPATTLTSVFVIQVDDSGTPTSSSSNGYSLEVVDQLTIFGNLLPEAVVGRPYSESIGVAGGETPFSWQVSSGSLPDGLALDSSTGKITGTPTTPNVFFTDNFQVEVTDTSEPPQTTFAFVRIPVQPPVRILTDVPIDCTAGFSYQGNIKIEGGRTPLHLRLVEGKLPPFVIFFDKSETRTIPLIGQCTEVGSFTFALEVTDSIVPPTTDTKTLTIRVNSRLEAQRVERLPEGLEGQPYSFTFQATGGVLPYEWRAARLPAGLAIEASTGTISGVPQEAFEGAVSIEVRDSSNPVQGQFLVPDLRIAGLLEILTTRLPNVKKGSAFRAVPALKGGTPPFTWSLASGSLPPGLTLDASSGEISGTPTSEATSDFVLQVTDSGTTFPQTHQQPLRISVTASLGRNDSIGTATPISNGTFRASISPYNDPSSSSLPDSDYYEVTASAGAVVTVEILAEQLDPPSPLDSVIEIVGSDGSPFESCRDPGDDGVLPPLTSDFTQVEFDDRCLNDDNRHVGTLDSKLEFLVPGTTGETVTFYVHVLDFRGDARPDFHYDIKISGAN